MPSRKKSRLSGSVTCLGTGDGWPCADRNHSSYLYELADTRLLIDCGESVSRTLAARKFDPNQVDAIVLSHTHPDHIGGLSMLLQGLWLEGRKRLLTIYLPDHAIGPLRRMLQHGYLFDELFNFKLRFVALRAGKKFKVGGMWVTPFSTSHLDGFRRTFHRKYRVGFDAYCFKLEGAGRRIIHSADLGSPGDLVPLLRDPVDLLVCELAHFTPAELFATLRAQPIKRAAFVHLSRDVRRRLAQVKRQAARSLPEIACTFPGDDDTLAI